MKIEVGRKVSNSSNYEEKLRNTVYTLGKNPKVVMTEISIRIWSKVKNLKGYNSKLAEALIKSANYIFDEKYYKDEHNRDNVERLKFHVRVYFDMTIDSLSLDKEVSEIIRTEINSYFQGN